ncbi:MAG: hypothetical protein GY757_31165 [bacterium]|nr:hypothetical protein [bacterium]
MAEINQELNPSDGDLCPVFAGSPKQRFVIYLLMALFCLYCVTAYFNFSADVNGLATFPLDDAWIFWGFSKTFAGSAELSLNAATPPGPGVTSPGYMLLLSLFIELGLTNEFLVNLILNCIFLFGAAVLLFKLIDYELKDVVMSFLIAVLFILDSRAVSIANSGMETFLFIFILLLVFWFHVKVSAAPLEKKNYRWFFLSLGIGFWVRPEILIVLPVLMVINFKSYFLAANRKKVLVKLFMGSLFFIVPFLCYFVFLKVFTGHFWLNTGAAKTDFYSYIPKWEYIKESVLYLGRTAFPVIPLLFLAALVRWVFVRKPGDTERSTWFGLDKNFAMIFCYFMIFWTAYFLYLPLLYHFGRYIFPLVPLLLIAAAFSLKAVSGKFKYAVYIVLFLAVVLGFYNFQKGKDFYAYECRSFLSRHIKLSYWINENLPEDVSIATHDIGAIGYFTGKRVIDIIGLMDSEAVGISRDPEAIRSFLMKRKCDYIAVISSWFVVQNAELLYETPVNENIRFQLYKYNSNSRVIRYDVYNERKDKD